MWERNAGAEHEDFFANGAQRLVKVPFLAQIYFSWSRMQKWYSNTKTDLEKSIGWLWCSHKILFGGKLELLGEKLPTG